ncbi:MAG TPA: ATP-binding cassette domain-containing protein [Gammaproteobacteria bacterium]|nr:ATP-binding cassette domain-containing protein [Gammaproteobacteria bacterium]
MLRIKDLSLRRGTRELLHDVNISFYAGQRVGITGANGVGKSSLFALIQKELHADAGDFFLTPNTTIAHVSQETPAVETPAIQYVKDGDIELRTIEKKIRQAELAQDGECLAHLYSDMETIEGYSANSRAGRLMHGLGFSSEQECLPVSAFSGGWRMRLNLAQALMCRSDLLLLDEPTNHLDLETVIWLEDWLRAYDGLLLLISHDRDFLDSVTTHIAHIEHQSLSLYTGNYSAFELLRAEQLANQQAQYQKQQRQIQHMQKFVDRFRAKASKATQAQSRIKALERMTIIGQAHVDSPFDFSFKKPASLPDPILRLEQASAGYQGKAIVSDINLNIVIGDRIGLLGHNGAGKSTLIKLLAGELGCIQGEIIPARGMQVGYFAQHQLEQLDGQASPLLHLKRIDPKASEQQLRSYLGGFAFHGDMAVANVAPFSGGEKARLVLALLVYQRPNFLLLDEPTNHLDLEMRLALTTALQDFEGAMIVVSHDRHLLRTVADTLMLVSNGHVSEFDGDLDDYRRLVREQEKIEQGNDADRNNAGINKKLLRQQAAEHRQKLKPLKNKLKKLEQKLDTLNREKSQLHEELTDTAMYDEVNKQKLQGHLARQAVIEQSLQEIEGQWLLLQEELEVIEV